MGNRPFYFWYKVVSLGYYPILVKLTQKNSKDCIQYQIPDNYSVETEVSKMKICCETKYQPNGKVRFTIVWKENKAEWSIYSDRSATSVVNTFLKKNNRPNSNLSGVYIFGFDIGRLHECRLETMGAPITLVNKKKRPLTTIQTISGQNKRFASLGRESGKAIRSLIKKHRLTDETDQPIVYIRKIELDFNGESIILTYKPPDNKNELAKIDAIVRACDESLLARDGYRRLAAVEAFLIREYLIANHRVEITNLINKDLRIGTFNIDKNDDDLSNNLESDDGIIVDEAEIGNGAYRSIYTILQTLIPLWKETSPAIINSGDTLKLKLGGDGRNVGRKQSHVMMTICLLNEGEEVLKPEHQHCICLYVGREKYEDLAKIGKLFQHQLFDLQNNGIYDKDGNHWPVELFFSGDWKFMYIIMGLNAPNSKYFCLYCNCQSELRWDMDQNFENSGNHACENRKPALFPAINQENYIPDELHLFLRIVDVLMECFFNDVIKKKEFEKKIKLEIEQTMQNIKVHFEFFKSRSTSGKWDWTSLMGPDKKKVLEYFPISQFISGIRGQEIEKLWKEFLRLYKVLRKPFLSDQEIDAFEIDTKQWIRTFYCATEGRPNSISHKPGLYRKQDVTPYMHVFAQHMHQFMRQLKMKNLSLRYFSTSSIEKKNHDQV
ncbi:hypothetical protein RclHR1_16080004 [Rhizophagus clarus]|uniref:Uncharacterized protein n=1 Tax=Rhizophagus clarus TaxID=94130 RepID=A0A2Z6QKX7_9GLOM|nr:hypothetical protein RclHR1_16080004 [Rhizophagus clarus]